MEYWEREYLKLEGILHICRIEVDGKRRDFMERDQLKQRILRESSKFISYLKELISENRFDDGEALEISLLVIKMDLKVYRKNNGMLFREWYFT